MSLTRFSLLFALVLCSLSSFARADHPRTVSGFVRDSTGAAIAGAKVTSADQQAMTSSAGEFELRDTTATTLTIAAPGFAAATVPVPANGKVDVMLAVSTVEERVSVTDTENAVGAQTLSREELATSPEMSLDSVLRSVPGFSLFRRTPSWSANGTASGASLRGVGATAASRALVVLDGVPMNDPFGGWVYWGRVTPQTLDRAEIIEGASSNLYGTDALSGVVNLSRAESIPVRTTVESSVGNLFTPMGTAVTSVALGRWHIAGIADAFRTNGYVPVPADQRGRVDTVLNSEHRLGSLEIGRMLSSGRWFVEGSMYGESRHNGTRLQTNGATLRDLRTGLELTGATYGTVSLRAFGGTESLRQTFSSVSEDRNTETLTRDQSVPVEHWGVEALWSRPVGNRQSFVAGVESRWVSGESFEWAFAQRVKTSAVRAGGTQSRTGVFGEDRIRLGRLLATASMRVDRWSNHDAFSSTTPLVPTVTARSQSFAARDEVAFSPKLSATYSVLPRLAFNASIGRSFRAPTLNELYRSFRVGNALTLSNSDLRAERLTGWEAGATFSATSRDTVRTTFFWNDISDPVQNVTLTITPSLITRQKQNMGALRSRGVEVTWESRWTQRLSTQAAYQFTDSTVTEFAAARALEGLWIPQVARNAASAGLRYAALDQYAFAVNVRYQGRQYDDDRNLFPLGSYVVVDAFVSKNLSRGLEGFIAADNLTNRRYQVGRTPTLTVGPPIVARAGLRWTWKPRQ